MNTGQDIYGMRKILDFSRVIGIFLLLLHFYFECYGAFKGWGYSSVLSDRLLSNIVRMGLFEKPAICKGLSLGFLIISLLGARGRKDARIRYSVMTAIFLVGLLIYWESIYILEWEWPAAWRVCWYMAICFAGWLIVLHSGILLSRVISYGISKEFFRKKESGFLQEQKFIESDYAINLKARYEFGGEFRESYINIVNGRRGILLIGSPGSGKSWFIVEPAIQQLIEKGFCMFVFDFKFDKLSRRVYSLFLKNRKAYHPSTKFYCINFSDLSRSHRCNLIEPDTMKYLSDAVGVSRTILLSINKSWVNRQGDFFVESPINLLSAVIWYLRKYKNGIYCTLPHAIELIQQPYHKLFTLLNMEVEIRSLINTFIEVYQNKTFEVLDSQMASVKIPLGRLASADVYYILTGNDLDLEVNDPAHPKLICLGGDPARQDALVPFLSLYIDRINKLVNRHGRRPCALILDEFATVRAVSVLNTVAVGRENNIISLLVVQDISQLRMQYSRAEADAVMNMTGNLICGQAGGETARMVSERFPGVVQHKTTVSVNSSDTSISRAEQTTPSISPATIATLSSGEFVGILADDPDKKMELKAFHAKILKKVSDAAVEELPIVRNVTAEMVESNFLRVKKEIEELVDTEMKRIMSTPELRQFIVKN